MFSVQSHQVSQNLSSCFVMAYISCSSPRSVRLTGKAENFASYANVDEEAVNP
jgi:hypothetical protein